MSEASRDAFTPPMPDHMLAYQEDPEGIRVGDRVMALAVLGPWAMWVWGWSVGVIAQEVVRVVRGR